VKILFVTNQGGGLLAGRTVRSFGLDFTVSSFTFETLVRFRRAPDLGPVVNRAALDRAVEEIEGHGGVLAEAPETVLLHFVRAKRGMRPLPWFVNTVQLLARVEPLRAAIRATYGEDPLALAAADARVRWIVTTKSHVDALAALGIPRERIVFFPSTSALQEAITPEAAAAYAGVEARPLPAGLEGMELLAAGTNNRDLVTLARAADLAGLRVHVIGDEPPPSRFLVRHAPIPLAEFVAATARAKALIVPLRAGDASCGQQTVAIAQRVRTLVVASDVPAMEAYVEHERSGLLVPPEDPAALGAALARALAEPRAREMAAAGFERDAKDGATVEAVLREVYGPPRG